MLVVVGTMANHGWYHRAVERVVARFIAVILGFYHDYVFLVHFAYHGKWPYYG